MEELDMQSNKLLALCCAIVISAFSSAALASDIGIGVPSWPSAQATAHIFKVALESKLGLEVELKNIPNTEIFAAIDAGTVHVHPEAWLPNLDYQRRKYVLNKKSIKMHPSGGIATQGMCVTKGTAERTGIKDLKDLANPEMAKKFDSDGDGKGEVWIGEAGWASIPVEQVRARSYGYDATMRLKIMEESVALAEVDAAVKGKKNIVFFYYTPHHMFAAHDLVILEEPDYDAKKWLIVPPSEVPGWLERSSAPVAWETATINVAYAVSLVKTHPKAAAMLSKVSLSTETLTKMSYALAVEKQDPAAFAAKWVEQNKAVVEGWFE